MLSLLEKDEDARCLTEECPYCRLHTMLRTSKSSFKIRTYAIQKHVDNMLVAEDWIPHSSMSGEQSCVASGQIWPGV